MALSALVGAGLCALPIRARAEGLALPANSQASLAEVQVSLIYVLLQLAHGPANASELQQQPFHFGILGQDPFGEKLEELTRLRIYGRPIQVHFARRPEELDDCDLIFVSRSEQRKLGEILEHYRRAPQILVSDIDDFAREGGTIGLVLIEGSVNYEINLKAARAAQVEFDIRVLGNAREVHQ